MENAALQVVELLLEAAVSTVALAATPPAESLGTAVELLGILRRIVLGTTRVRALGERVLTLKAVGAHAAARLLLTAPAGDGSTSARLLSGGGADRLLQLFQLGHDGSNVDLDVPDGDASADGHIAVLKSPSHPADVCGQVSLANDKLRVLVVAVVVLHVDVRTVTMCAIGAYEGP